MKDQMDEEVFNVKKNRGKVSADDDRRSVNTNTSDLEDGLETVSRRVRRLARDVESIKEQNSRIESLIEKQNSKLDRVFANMDF